MNDRTDRLALVTGCLFATLGVTGLLRAADLLPDPGWLPLALVAAALAAGGIVRSARTLLAPPPPAGGQVDGDG